MARSTRARGSSRQPARRAPARAPAGRHAGLTVLFWVCFAAIVVAVAVAARGPLFAALDRLRGTSPAPAGTGAPAVTVTPLPADAPATTTTKGPAADAAPAVTATPAPKPSASPQPTVKITTPAPKATTPSASPAKSAATPATRAARLYFARVADDGSISVRSVVRAIPASDSPLRDTLQALLKGPTSQELNLGLVSMIPVDAALRGVTMAGSTAMVDFTESFRRNAQGLDAMTAQLRQVVYAATEFPTVKSVQVLIEGRAVAYLGAEGVRIDRPLTRASFQE